ncbi:hypothetical protein niasHS_001568 [Heterodera schachtii]|uniref:Uncharacterized protein n=1 Tax=Heterodera schachtii TaxID=97005 RepID=A0ABD2KEI3_HETSC
MCRLTFSLFLCISPLIAVFATQWPGASVAEKAELLDAAFPSEALVAIAKACEAKTEERAAQVEEAKRNALQPFPPHAAPNHSAELQRTAKAKAAAQFYTRMREQYKAEGEHRILQEYVSPFADCAADCAQLMQNLANAHNELSILRDGEQKQLQKQHKGNKQFRENLLVEADMELEALAAALGSAQLALQRLEERHERTTEWLMPSTFDTLKTLSKFSLHNAMAGEKEKRKPRKEFNNSSSNSESGDEAAKAETTESGGEQWENIPLK